MSGIPLDTLIPHGKVQANICDGVLKLTTQSDITSIAYNLVGDSYKRHYVALAQKARIPFTLTIQLKLDGQGLIFLIGDGHILLNCPTERAIADPILPSAKALMFGGKLPQNTFVTVTIHYGLKEAQILIDGKEAFYSAKMPYMKAKEMPTLNENGLRIGFEIAKRSTLWVKDIMLSEPAPDEALARPIPYETTPTPPASEFSASASGFERMIARFPADIQKEMIETDECFKALKPLKMKRTIDRGNEKMTYVSSDFGVSYAIRYANGESWQHFSFYIITSGKAETWHRKADYMEEALQEIAQSDPGLAERIFFAMNECVGCYGTRCIVKTPYAFQGKKKVVCHGVVKLHLCPADFSDVRAFFRHLNAMLERKAAEGTLQTSCQYLLQ